MTHPQRRGFSSYNRNRYLALADPTECSLSTLIGRAESIGRSSKSSHKLAAGDCMMEAALHPNTTREGKNREDLLSCASDYWRSAVHKGRKNEFDESPTLAFRALCHIPTHAAIALHLNRTKPPHGIYDWQNDEFEKYFSSTLETWNDVTSGCTLRALMNYFVHRSNRLMPGEPQLLTVPSSVRNIYNEDASMRTDANIYNLGAGLKYGMRIIAKGKKHSRDRGNNPGRVLYTYALNSLTFQDKPEDIRPVMEAIIGGVDQTELDDMAVAVRQRITKKCTAQPSAGVPIMPLKYDPVTMPLEGTLRPE